MWFVQIVLNKISEMCVCVSIIITVALFADGNGFFYLGRKPKIS